VVQGTTNPAPCCHLANDTDLLTSVLWAMAGDNKQIDLWPADPFTRIDPKLCHKMHSYCHFKKWWWHYHCRQYRNVVYAYFASPYPLYVKKTWFAKRGLMHDVLMCVQCVHNTQRMYMHVIVWQLISGDHVRYMTGNQVSGDFVTTVHGMSRAAR